MKIAFWEDWVVLQPERILLRKHISMQIPTIIERMLDVGGGSGSRYRGLFNAKSYICLDIDSSLNPDVVASADDIPFPDNSFDFVFSSQMLEHVEYPRKCILEMHRCLDVRGYLLITVPQANELHSEPYDYWRFTNFGMELLLQEAGFEILSKQQRGNMPTVIAQMRIRRWIDSTDVYNNKKWLLLLYPVSSLYVKFAQFLDRFYNSEASKKHTLGWTYLAQKV
jgi:SAM-dependent methyltransferase